MQTIHYTDLVHRFAKVPVKQLKWLTPIQQIQSLIVQDSQQPENLNDTFFDPNDFYVHAKLKYQKYDRKNKQNNTKEFIMGKKVEDKKQKKEHKNQHTESKQHIEAEDQVQSPEEKKKIYRAGPFALFYEFNENRLDKDEEVWYYKQQKDIIGPVSSYNMDKMAYYKNVDDETKVAYKSLDKFVKFSKIKKVVESNKKPSTEEPISSEQSQ